MPPTATTGAPLDPLAGLPADVVIPQLYDRHARAIYALGRRVCRSPAEAEDMVQETFFAAWDRWLQFEGRSSARSWLFTIARRICQRMHRPRAGEPTVMESFEELLPGEEASLPQIERRQPFSDALKAEAAERLDRALAELPIEFRVPLVLREVAELSIAEIAEVLDLRENTAKTRIHRGRLKLRRALESLFPAAPAVGRSQPSEVCYSLLLAKLDALDRGVDLPVSDSELCERCRNVFATLDLGHEACLLLAQDEVPARVEERLRERARPS
ncbi:MAG TPA: sigma-70 family RNA polymerase sigma factor [Thermoanaerobaculia bacterium]|nr:sigma-70 family RNA polymerase sigma factor [Thermoanaerobaculia bacterium]